jgi:hypothetical protein
MENSLTVQFKWKQFLFIKALIKQPSDQYEKQHNVQTQITKNSKQRMYETNINKRRACLDGATYEISSDRKKW